MSSCTPQARRGPRPPTAGGPSRYPRRAAAVADPTSCGSSNGPAPCCRSDAGDFRRRGAPRVAGALIAAVPAPAGFVGLTHGHETWWARVPAARRLLRRIGDSCDHLTTISGFTERRIASALSPGARRRLLRLAPPVDIRTLPTARGSRHTGYRGRCIAVARLIPQKGVSTLLRAWRAVIDRAAREWRCARADHRWGRSVAGPAGTNHP